MNVPDDWGNYWRTCDRGHRYHESEGGCQECEEIEEALELESAFEDVDGDGDEDEEEES